MLLELFFVDCCGYWFEFVEVKVGVFDEDIYDDFECCDDYGCDEEICVILFCVVVQCVVLDGKCDEQCEELGVEEKNVGLEVVVVFLWQVGVVIFVVDFLDQVEVVFYYVWNFERW